MMATGFTQQFTQQLFPIVHIKKTGDKGCHYELPLMEDHNPGKNHYRLSRLPYLNKVPSFNSKLKSRIKNIYNAVRWNN